MTKTYAEEILDERAARPNLISEVATLKEEVAKLKEQLTLLQGDFVIHRRADRHGLDHRAKLPLWARGPL